MLYSAELQLPKLAVKSDAYTEKISLLHFTIVESQYYPTLLFQFLIVEDRVYLF